MNGEDEDIYEIVFIYFNGSGPRMTFVQADV